MRGHKENGKFHPHKKYQQVRKKRSPSTIDGVKIIKKTKSPDTKLMLNGIKESLDEQPKAIRSKIKSITLKEKGISEDYVAKVDTNTGQVTLNHKPDLTEGDYKALSDHEFEHIDFNTKLENENPKYEKFIDRANQIEPFTPDLVLTLDEREQAFIDGNFGILPDKELEYPDEINSVIIEIETREKLGLPTKVFNEDEFEKAKRLVDNLHKK